MAQAAAKASGPRLATRRLSRTESRVSTWWPSGTAAIAGAADAVGRQAGQRRAVERHAAGGGRQEAGERGDQRALAGAVRSEEGEDAAALEAEAHLVEHRLARRAPPRGPRPRGGSCRRLQAEPGGAHRWAGAAPRRWGRRRSRPKSRTRSSRRRAAISPTSWSTRTTIAPKRAGISESTWRSRAASAGRRPAPGSSRRMIFGRPATALAISTIRRSKPSSSAPIALARGPRPTCASAAAISADFSRRVRSRGSSDRADVVGDGEVVDHLLGLEGAAEAPARAAVRGEREEVGAEGGDAPAAPGRSRRRR